MRAYVFSDAGTRGRRSSLEIRPMAARAALAGIGLLSTKQFLKSGVSLWCSLRAVSRPEEADAFVIVVPTPFKQKIEQEKRDPDTNLPVLETV